jgi:hypothetical protein
VGEEEGRGRGGRGGEGKAVGGEGWGRPEFRRGKCEQRG